jgi:hypothetical protein
MEHICDLSSEGRCTELQGMSWSLPYSSKQDGIVFLILRL